MDPLLKDIQFPLIIKPGEVYILSEDEDRNCKIDCIDFAYVLQSDEEIVLALEMETGRVMNEYLDFKKYLGYEKISDDSHVFRFLCCEKGQTEEETLWIYLHRMNTFQEKLAAIMRRRYRNRWREDN